MEPDSETNDASVSKPCGNRALCCGGSRFRRRLTITALSTCSSKCGKVLQMVNDTRFTSMSASR